MTAEWRAVPDYEGLYEVSRDGQVRSVDRTDRTGHRWRGRVLKQQANAARGGYLGVALSRDGAQRKRRVHQMVAEAFHGPQPEGTEVRHLNGNPIDNRAENLAFGSRSENQFDSVDHGTHGNGSKSHCPQDHAYDEINTYVQPSTGGRICRPCTRAAGRRWKARNRRRQAAT